MPRSRLAILATLALLGAAPPPLALDAANAEIGFRVYGFGMLPVDGQFARFTGSLARDPADPAACRIELAAETDSLAMPTDDMRATALAPGLLDSAAFPTMRFRGSCQGDTLVGDLTLHGRVGPMTFALTRRSGSLEAEGRLARGQWGMTGSTTLVGDTVRIRVVVRG